MFKLAWTIALFVVTLTFSNISLAKDKNAAPSPNSPNVEIKSNSYTTGNTSTTVTTGSMPITQSGKVGAYVGSTTTTDPSTHSQKSTYHGGVEIKY
ncbi:MAG: hypothetical protein RDU30_00575 [Desulfovibrionaceae bacterium]|nr:hypothetical protein [Desulfovibrionaceae bacterium]